MKKRIETLSGIEVAPFYTSRDIDGVVAPEVPGTFPFTRGLYEGMYRDKMWTIRQYAGFGSASETNARYQFLLQQGITGLSVAFDLPTQMGLDPDSPRAKGEVGRVGVSIATVEDMEGLLKDLPLDRISLSMTINSTATTLLAFLLVVAERRGVPWDKLKGTVQNDILKEYIARGTYIYPPDKGLALTTDLIEFCSSRVPNWNTISVSGYHMREAGCTAIQEVAFTLADGIVYLEHARDRGLDLNLVGERISFFFNCHNDLFEEISKFRAARRAWAKITRDRFGLTNPRAQMLRFHTQTAGSSLTLQQPRNNIVRTTLQALAAVLGGTQSLHTNGFDEAIGLPTEEAAALAVRTQQILAHESGVANSADPLGGSYYIESLTDQIEEAVFEELSEIERHGGMLRAIEDGYPQEQIELAAFREQRRIESGERKVIGVNFANSAGREEVESLRLDPASELERVREVSCYKSRREQSRVLDALKKLEMAAVDRENTLPHIILAARAGCSLGEISGTLRKVFGEFTATK